MWRPTPRSVAWPRVLLSLLAALVLVRSRAAHAHVHAAGGEQAAARPEVPTASGSQGSTQVVEDNWYIVRMGAQVVGKMHGAVTKIQEPCAQEPGSSGQGQPEARRGEQGLPLAKGLTCGAPTYQSTEALEVVLQRGSDRTAMMVDTEVVEEADGSLRMQRMAHQLGAISTTTVRYVWRDDGRVAITSSSGTSLPILRDEPAPGGKDVTGRWQSERYFRERVTAGEEHVMMKTLRPEFGLETVNMTRTLLNRSEVLLDTCHDATGTKHVRQVSVWLTQMEGVPMNVTEWYESTADGLRLVQSEMPSPFGSLVCTLCDGADAQAQLEGAAAEAVRSRTDALPEIVYSVAVRLAAPLPGISASGRRVVWRVRHAAGLPLSLPSAGYQAVTPFGTMASGKGGLRVTVDQTARLGLPATKEELENTEYSTPSVMVDSGDKVIQDLAQQILREAGVQPEAGSLERARLLRTGTRRHITHSTLATGFATATETANTRQGDCTEHAMLLAALLRAERIPSRVCTGIVYSESYGDSSDAAVHGTDGTCAEGSGESCAAAAVTALPTIGQLFRVSKSAVVRSGEALTSPKLGTLRRGEVLRVAQVSETAAEQDPSNVQHRIKFVRSTRAGEQPTTWGDKEGGWASVKSRAGVTLLAALPDATAARARSLAAGGSGRQLQASLVWHMWTQALIEGHWVDVDATLNSAFHPGHVLVSTSSMVDVLTLRSSEMKMLQMIGALEVDVIESI